MLSLIGTLIDFRTTTLNHSLHPPVFLDLRSYLRLRRGDAKEKGDICPVTLNEPKVPSLYQADETGLLTWSIELNSHQ